MSREFKSKDKCFAKTPALWCGTSFSNLVEYRANLHVRGAHVWWRIKGFGRSNSSLPRPKNKCTKYEGQCVRTSGRDECAQGRQARDRNPGEQWSCA